MSKHNVIVAITQLFLFEKQKINVHDTNTISNIISVDSFMFVYFSGELVCFTLIAEARIPLKPSCDIWSLINEFKGDTTMTIESAAAIQKPFDFH